MKMKFEKEICSECDKPSDKIYYSGKKKVCVQCMKHYHNLNLV